MDGMTESAALSGFALRRWATPRRRAVQWLLRGFAMLYTVSFLNRLLFEGVPIPVIRWVIAIAAVGFLLYHLFHAGREALGVFHPVVRVSCDRRTVRLGEEFTVRWALGDRREIRRILVTVEARRFKRDEGSAYPRYEQVLADREVLTSFGPFEFEDANSMRSGSLTLRMPDDAPVTRSRHRRWQAWLILVHAEVMGLPDLHEEFEIRVLRKRRADGSRPGVSRPWLGSSRPSDARGRDPGAGSRTR